MQSTKSKDRVRQIRKMIKQVSLTLDFGMNDVEIIMSKTGVVFFLCLLTQLLLGQTVNSEVYKWIDENGKIVYGDRPRSGHSEKIIIKKAPPQDNHAIQQFRKQKKLLDVMREERDTEFAAKQKAKENKAKQKQKCVTVKEKLQKMRDASILYENTDDPNNPRIASTEERKTEEKRYERYIDKNC